MALFRWYQNLPRSIHRPQCRHRHHAPRHRREIRHHQCHPVRCLDFHWCPRIQSSHHSRSNRRLHHFLLLPPASRQPPSSAWEHRRMQATRRLETIEEPRCASGESTACVLDVEARVVSSIKLQIRKISGPFYDVLGNLSERRHRNEKPWTPCHARSSGTSGVFVGIRPERTTCRLNKHPDGTCEQGRDPHAGQRAPHGAHELPRITTPAPCTPSGLPGQAFCRNLAHSLQVLAALSGAKGIRCSNGFVETDSRTAAKLASKYLNEASHSGKSTARAV
jgi:hypothetical protein